MSRMRSKLEQTVISFKRRLIRSKIAMQNRSAYRKRRPSIPEYELAGKNVLFLVVDCLRDDHLSPGYERETTPFLGQFDRSTAVSAAPWTFASMPSILSGLYPHNHGAIYETPLRNQEEGDPPKTVREDVYTVLELADAAGYETYFSTAIGTAELPLRGRFQSASIQHNATADVLVDELLSWWDAQGQDSRCAYVQLGDLHAPLPIPDEQPFGEIPDMEGLTRWRFGETTEPKAEFERYRSERVRLYDTVLRSVDRQLQRLYDELDRRGDLEETILVITSDHGEEFWEREQLERNHFHDPRGVYGAGHGHALVPEVLEVPLIIPDIAVETEFVSTTDIAPTVLTELGYPSERVGRFDGDPLQNTSDDRPLLSEEIAYGYDQQAVIKGNYHLIHSPHESEVVLLDRSENEVVTDESVITELLEYTTAEKQYGGEVTIDSETERRLADLGYIN